MTGDKIAYAYDNAPRCGARSKINNGAPCRAPAIKNKARCRFHGGKGSGARVGNSNALRHGQTTQKMKNFRILVKKIISAT
jgi:hypothetical protein